MLAHQLLTLRNDSPIQRKGPEESGPTTDMWQSGLLQPTVNRPGWLLAVPTPRGFESRHIEHTRGPLNWFPFFVLTIDVESGY